MKFVYFLTAAAAVYGVEAQSTVVCSGCPPASSTNDIVTREPVPTVNCTAAPLTPIYSDSTMTTSTGMGNGTGVPTDMPGSPTPTGPVPGGSNKVMAGALGGLTLLAMAFYI